MVEGIEVEEEEEVMYQEEDKQPSLQVNLKVGIDFVSGAEILLLLMMQTILSKNALIIRKLERNGGKINSKHLLLNLQILHLKTQPLRKPVRNPSEDGNGIPSKQPSTFGRNTGMNDDEWYHELRARYKMAMSIEAQKERDN